MSDIAGSGMSDIAGAVLVFLLAILLIGLFLALRIVAVAKGRWWVALLGAASLASVVIIFTTEPSDSFQDSTTFKAVEAGLNIALYGGAIAFIYGAAAKAKPGSWWDRRYPPSPNQIQVRSPKK